MTLAERIAEQVRKAQQEEQEARDNSEEEVEEIQISDFNGEGLQGKAGSGN